MTSSASAFYPSGHWASNVGNAFFNLGTAHLLDSCGLKVVHSDLPPQKAFGTESTHVSLAHYNVDKSARFLVLDGPMFDENFGRLFGPYLEKAKQAGLKIALLSTGMIEYNDAEKEHCLGVLSKYRPDVITTRDSRTYEVFKSASANVFDGICHAWFVPDAYPGFETSQSITSVFDHAQEPRLQVVEPAIRNAIRGQTVTLPLDVRHSTWNKVARLTQRSFDTNLGELPIVRACHQVLARGNWRLFFKPDIVCAQTPYIYLNLYRNSLLTLTDRLHASVATLAYGRPAVLFNKSNRCFLLDRLGLNYRGGSAMHLDPSILEREKAAYRNWLKAALCD